MASLRYVSGLILAALTACGPAPVSPDDVAFRPGMSLLEAVDDARLVSLPASSLPPQIESASSGPLEVTYEASDWTLGKRPDIEVFLNRLPGSAELPSDARRWHLRDAIRLDLPRGECTVTCDGDELLRIGEEWAEVDSADVVFVGPKVGVLVWFTAATGRLALLGEAPPTSFTVRYAGDDGASRGAWEWSGGIDEERLDDSAFPRVLTHPDELPDADVLVRRIDLQGTTRDALLLPPPGALGFDVDVRDVEAISFAVGMVDYGFVSVSGSPVRKPAVSDGARVSLVVERQLERVELWSDTVQPGEAWRDVTVPLGGVLDDPRCTLWLVTDGGEADDVAFDYVAFSGLRSVGRGMPAPARPSAILIVLDTLRDDTYGKQQPRTTPALDRWAEGRATRYVTTRSPAPWTLPATVSMLSGLDPAQHTVDKANETMGAGLPHIAELLRDVGYETRAYTGGGYVARPFGLDRGFDVFVARSDHDRVPEWGAAVDWLATRRSERPFFLLLHTYYVHATYVHDPRFENPANPYDGQLAGKDVDYTDVIFPFTEGRLTLSDDDIGYVRRMYDAGAARIDEIVVETLTAMGDVIDLDDVAVFITSDHGEEFFEHGALGHGHSLHAELIDVPLVVQWPARAGLPPRDPRSARRSTIVDITPTLLDLAAAEIPAEMSGVSLLEPAAPDRPLLASLDDLRRLSDGDFVLMLGPGKRVTLFDEDADPTGTVNLAARQPERVERLRRRLAELEATLTPVAGGGDAATLDAAAVEALRAMGYLDETADEPGDG